MRAGTYHADYLLPGDRLEYEATVVDCIGDGAFVQLEIERADKSRATVRLPRLMPVVTY